MSDVAEETVIVNGVEVFEGYYVKVLHSPGHRDGFIGEFKYARYDCDGNVVSVDCWGGKKGFGKYRTIPVDRIKMISTRIQNRLQREDQLARDEGSRPPWRAYSDV